MKKIAAILLTAVMMLTACAPKGQHVPSDNDTEEDKVTEITIPASYLDFTGNDAEETAEEKDDFSGVVYRYDESIESGVQAKMLMGVTSMYALNGIIESGNSDWSVEVTIENCHTGNAVAQGVLPDDSITFGQEEWEASYE
jgi:hypothetical protein